MSQPGRVIHRIPSYILGPEVLMVADVEDRQPWSLVNRNIEPLWAETMGEDKTVCILDTGLWKHRDLPEPVFAENFTRSRTVFDKQGHGTHVAGTVGARLDGSGVVGWAPKINLACCKVLGDDGTGSSRGIADGIRFAMDKGVDIISMSLGGGYDRMIEEACRDAVQAGIFVICAAGNEGYQGGQNTIGYPGRLPETLAIASYRKDGSISEYSSRGREVDMAFPGEDILSTWPNNTFRSISGTSMACPAAAGLTGLMLSYTDKAKAEGKEVKPVRNNSELRQRWSENAQDMGEKGKDNDFGWGIPDAGGIVRAGVTGEAPEDRPPAPGSDVGFELFGGLHVSLHDHDGKSGVFIYVKTKS